MNARRAFCSFFKCGRNNHLVIFVLWIFIIGITTTERVHSGWRENIPSAINIHPSSCTTPFLNQASSLRWHERYLMNPLSGEETWIICPVNFNPLREFGLFLDYSTIDFTIFSRTYVSVSGTVIPGAYENKPICFFTIYDASNTDQSPYLDLPNGAKEFTIHLQIYYDPPFWTAENYGAKEDISASINRNAPFGTVQMTWGASVFCKLPPGHSISLIRLNYIG